MPKGKLITRKSWLTSEHARDKISEKKKKDSLAGKPLGAARGPSRSDASRTGFDNFSFLRRNKDNYRIQDHHSCRQTITRFVRRQDIPGGPSFLSRDTAFKFPQRRRPSYAIARPSTRWQLGDKSGPRLVRSLRNGSCGGLGGDANSRRVQQHSRMSCGP